MLLVISIIFLSPFLPFTFTFTFTSASSTGNNNKSMSAHDVLRSHGLPIGLLPNNVRNFTIDDSGSFRATIDAPCTAKFESDVHYDRNISGKISYAHLTSLSGISAQELFLWFPVREIRVDVPSSGLIYFDVGVIYKQFSLSLFETPPNCVPTSKLSSHSLTEGTTIARVASQRGSGKLQYELDQEAGEGEKAVL